MDYKKIKSYESACKALGLKPISDEVFNAFQKEDRKTMEAYHKLAVITRAINEGWQPDWSNREERKYEPYMYTNSAGLAYACTAITPPRLRVRLSVRGFASATTNAPRLPLKPSGNFIRTTSARRTTANRSQQKPPTTSRTQRARTAATA